MCVCVYVCVKFTRIDIQDNHLTFALVVDEKTAQMTVLKYLFGKIKPK